MKFRHPLNQIMRSCIFLLPMALSTFVFAETIQESETWSYHKEWDKLTNRNYSLARSPLPKRGLYDNIRMDLICKDDKLQFAVDANSLITSQGRVFDFEYQIDKNNPVTLSMQTYPDSKRRGYTDDQVERIAEALLSGQSIFIRIYTLIRTVLTAAAPLDGAAQPVQQVLADCGVVLQGRAQTQAAYSLTDFERDFQKLSETQQRQVMDKLKAILNTLP
ncbi:MAG: hypothetical protein CVV13_02985 [Gammaproteobacteria bacterium HGW-Gammaproteobacteria-3]|nr:MAG: hypothetical protein CVV13_02985 [Gammaproteobacteria bacterium HGW-Gammaproteobacteria-3]